MPFIWSDWAGTCSLIATLEERAQYAWPPLCLCQVQKPISDSFYRFNAPTEELEPGASAPAGMSGLRADATQ
jgi:hypothetical protein